MEPRRGKCKLKCHKILINIQLFFLLKHSPGCNFWVSAQSSEKLITDIFFLSVDSLLVGMTDFWSPYSAMFILESFSGLSVELKQRSGHAL